MSADGTWNITMDTPMGSQQATLELATDGATVGGKMVSPQGAIDITNGKVDGDNLTWVAEMTQPMPISLEFSAKVEGDNISGTVALGSFGSATFSGTRA